MTRILCGSWSKQMQTVMMNMRIHASLLSDVKCITRLQTLFQAPKVRIPSILPIRWLLQIKRIHQNYRRGRVSAQE
jgi:hypothetical protein